jgi:phosphatidate cytidylyltransferase
VGPTGGVRPGPGEVGPGNGMVPPMSSGVAGRQSGAGSELSRRVASAIVLVLVALAATWFGGWPFAMIWLAAGIVIAMEAIEMAARPRGRSLIVISAVGLTLLAVIARLGSPSWAALAVVLVTLAALTLTAMSRTDRLWAIAGWLYAAIVVWVPITVRDRPDLALAAILWMFAVVWSTDIAAFFVGRRLGGPKLWRRVSPGKTWSGFAGGLVAATLAGIAVAMIAREHGSALPFGLGAVAAVSALASIVAQLGDLGESALKRHFAVKDSGHLIPGHGGVMDRLDGFVAVAFLVGIALLGARLLAAQG